MLTPRTLSRGRPATPNPTVEIAYAALGLFFALLSWVINPWFLPSLLGLAFSIRGVVRVKRLEGRQHTIVLVLAVLGIVIGGLALIGSAVAVGIRTS